MHILLAMLAATSPATAAEAPPQAVPSATTVPQQPGIVVKGKKERKICKDLDAPTGSHIGEQRICRTATEWRVIEEAAQRTVDQDNRRTEAVRSEMLNRSGALSKPGPM